MEHHHINQGGIAAPIPQKVHRKWSAILHEYKSTGKIASIANRLNSFASILTVFQAIIDYYNQTPDAVINILKPYNEVNKLYYLPEKDVYFEVAEKQEKINTQGEVIELDITYIVYESYVFDQDEQRSMGVIKLGKYREIYNTVTKQTTYIDFNRMF